MLWSRCPNDPIMPSSQEIEFEGVTTFPSPPAASFRYVIQLKRRQDEYLDGRQEKQEAMVWYAFMLSEAHPFNANFEVDANAISRPSRYRSGMTKSDYITAANVVTDAEMVDYLESVYVEISTLDKNWRLFNSKASSKNASSSYLQWDEVVQSSNFEVNKELGVVTVHRSGVYSVAAMVNCVPYRSNHDFKSISLLSNSKVALVIPSPFKNYAQGFSMLSTMIRLNKGDFLIIKCDSAVTETSYLSIAWLGR
ncbi:unnamed protein product [Phytophthora fragariaefolia]|uniref:Unnamed protein product n=1 Tax=Phytophthora fragariaefolia TaxID=1490495 RepID=A0A9W6XJ18_9STRA|nr:unnamed protein product [Phytophthora fragariaefolia]